MYHFSKIFVLFFIFSSCTSLEQSGVSQSAVYPYSFSAVWSATLRVLKDYPIEVEIRESGEIKTKEIRGYSVWSPPEGAVPNKSSRTYRLNLLLEKGSKAVGSSPATRVNIMKNEFENQSFILQDVPVQSNGLEENLIFYRIQRELYLLDRKNKFINKKKKDKELKKEEVEF